MDKPSARISLDKSLLCDHRYRVLNDKTETFYAEGTIFATRVNAVFYCEKCLGITHVIEEKKIRE